MSTISDRISLEVITPEGVVFEGAVSSLNAPAALGLLGVLPGHAPLMTALDMGIMDYTEGSVKKKMALFGGFMEVRNNRVTILADVAELSESIDKARAEQAMARARKRLEERNAALDVSRAEASMARALVRLSVTK